MSPRILHLSGTDTQGGAARGSYWLHRALVDGGTDSRMLVDRKFSDDETVKAPANGNAVIRRLRAMAERAPLASYRPTGESFWSTNWVPSLAVRAVRNETPDIVHIHWGGGGFLPVEAVARFGCPVVWTLRDMWPFTGGCHYTAGCDFFRTGCGACPQLRSTNENDLSRKVFNRKRDAWQDSEIWPVPISKWLADEARSSPLFHGRPMEIIPNGLDTERFRPSDRNAARREWHLPLERKLILFGALHATTDTRKGFSELCDAIRQLARDGAPDRYMLVVFGADESDGMKSLGIDVVAVGNIADDRRIATLYAAADVMVTPSLQEAFGKTLIEAMACATPVVAFDHGGPADIVEHKRSGYLARPFEAADLAAGIAWCLDGDERLKILRRHARERVERYYDICVVARQYTDLYQRILNPAQKQAA